MFIFKLSCFDSCLCVIFLSLFFFSLSLSLSPLSLSLSLEWLPGSGPAYQTCAEVMEALSKWEGVDKTMRLLQDLLKEEQGIISVWLEKILT